VAGPGSGKSFAINKRILRLLESGVSPDNILAITFTRTAAHDLKSEISSLGIEGAEQVHTRTVHSHALRILMKDGVLDQTGRVPRMVIEHEQQPILRDLDREEFEGVRNKKQLLDSYLAGWAKLQQDEPGFTESQIAKNFKSDLLEWFNNHSGILVGEVIPIVVEYLRNNPAVDYRNEYEYILVDEFQDLNKSEQEFIRLIRGDANLVIVGDDDQSIYGFKFAHPQGIQEIDDLFGDFVDVPFDVCRRCPTLVTQMASNLISNNPNRTLGDLNAFADNPEGIVNIVQWTDYDAEMNGLSQFIVQELGKGIIEPSDILILSPRRKIGYRLRDLLLTACIPVKSYFRESVINKAHVQRSFSLMNFLAQPEDKISLRFLLGFNSTDYRRNQYSRLLKVATERNQSVKEILDSILRTEIPETNLRSIVATYRSIVTDISNLKNAIIDDPLNGYHNFFITNPEQDNDYYELDQVYRKVLEEIGTESIEEDENNFDTWFKEIMQSMLETIALPDTPENIDHVRIMSLHSSKGLSAKLVILTSMIDQLIPFLSNANEPGLRDSDIEEARRLFYVAITRCKASNDYDGRLVISSFLSIPGVEASPMGISANTRGFLRTMSSRFVTEFGAIAPAPIRGVELN
ncbi:MAG: ATP-dependent helicase, partial [Bacteroidetes bacterium]|nr:ATP-dependent helicase [Bacteroidota bacterium]